MATNRKMKGAEATPQHFLSLPIEVVFDILSRCTVEDITRWRCACKEFYQVPKDPGFIEQQLERPTCRPPCIIFSSPYHNPDWIYFEEGRCKRIPNRYKSKSVCIRATCNGLLCLTDQFNSDNHAIVIHNPFTNDSADLPRPMFSPDLISKVEFGFGFGYDLVHKKYKVVRVYNIYPDMGCRHYYSAGEVITLGESSWRQLKFPFKVKSCGGDIIDTVTCSDAFYWMMQDEKVCSFECILVFDIVNEKFHTIRLSPVPEFSLTVPMDSFYNLPDAIFLLKHRKYIEIFKYGDGVGIAEKIPDGDFLEIGKVVGNGTTGYRLSRDSFYIFNIFERITMCIRFLGVWYGGIFLFTGLECCQVGTASKLSGLIAFFDPEKDESVVHEVVGITQPFGTFPVVPSLVSPTSLIGSRGRDTRQV